MLILFQIQKTLKLYCDVDIAVILAGFNMVQMMQNYWIEVGTFSQIKSSMSHDFRFLMDKV